MPDISWDMYRTLSRHRYSTATTNSYWIRKLTDITSSFCFFIFSLFLNGFHRLDLLLLYPYGLLQIRKESLISVADPRLKQKICTDIKFIFPAGYLRRVIRFTVGYPDSRLNFNIKELLISFFSSAVSFSYAASKVRYL